MNVACCIGNDGAFEALETILIRHRLACERLGGELALMRAIRRRSYDLIVFEMTGSALQDDGFFSWLGCRSGETTPVLLLGAGTAPERIAEAFDSGADEYCALPLEPVEVGARMRALLRRRDRLPVQRTIEHHGFVLDREASVLRDHGRQVELTPREFTMAWLFFSTPGVYISRDTISVAIWGVGSEIASRTIEQHVYKLRKKLALGPERGVLLRTAYTQGYRLELVGSGAAAIDIEHTGVVQNVVC
ncbi:winged helix-turn-helix domain-containing protein [Massilia oculi]|jgi:DNA-binding response OmpR family regulator|uniref:DNA-binding response regulator n=1 Tax=Massilia oculi TaxID=945844 RepID=A0A2S2DDR3_9BURK|nr:MULTISPECIES: response regulator transcription factor [Massilia]AWL03523.1 DNA-binding response regulator [Massilia oculi]MDY0977281.1 response regulator transcription factor [Massilia sp. CFBP9012]